MTPDTDRYYAWDGREPDEAEARIMELERALEQLALSVEAELDGMPAHLRGLLEYAIAEARAYL